jgi:hypothetical protein
MRPDERTREGEREIEIDIPQEQCDGRDSSHTGLNEAISLVVGQHDGIMLLVPFCVRREEFLLSYQMRSCFA